jgi:hypothetical protein
MDRVPREEVKQVRQKPTETLGAGWTWLLWEA